MSETLSSPNISTKLERIAKQAREAPKMAFRTLAHHIDVEWLREAHRRTRRDGAVGVDGQTADEYERELEKNLRSLLDRAKAGTYQAPPVRRVYIPKGNGRELRPLGIPTFEDKILQRAIAMLLDAIYEQDFLNCSYGFRPRRSAHQALETFQTHSTKTAGGWILEVDLQKFFDSVDRGRLQAILRRRVQDGVVLRLIGKWLRAGALEKGKLTSPISGTPQGGVISPILANIFLHDALDLWFENQVKPRLRDWALLIRYADDALLVFGQEADAKKVLAVLPDRLTKYGLTLHPEKTRLINFRRPDHRTWKQGGPGPGTFDLLGFTHYWAKSSSGKWTVKRRTAKNRFQRSLKRITDWCHRNRHCPVRAQWENLSRQLRGHYGYFGIAGNSIGLARFHRRVNEVWCKWLRRRSQRPGSWDRTRAVLKRYPLPTPRVKALDEPDDPHRQRTLHPKSRMRESRTSGSVGGRGGQLPRSTR